MFRLEFTNTKFPPTVPNEELRKVISENETKQVNKKKPTRLNQILSKSRDILAVLGVKSRPESKS